MPACPACGSIRMEHWFVKENDFGSFPVMKCSSCRSAFIWPRPKKDDIEAFYRSSSYKTASPDQISENVKAYHPTGLMDAVRMLKRLRRMTRGKRLLDIGAGYGEFSKAAREAGLEVTACEPNENSRSIFAAINGFEPMADMFDASFASRFEGMFDMAVLSQVLEHIPDPGDFLDNLHRVLDQAGVVVIAVPHFGSLISKIQGKNDMFIHPPEHLNFFSRKSLQALAVKTGFELIAIETVSKVNRNKIRALLRWPIPAEVAWRTLYLAMKSTEIFHLGMVLNIYLKKKGELSSGKDHSGRITSNDGGLE